MINLDDIIERMQNCLGLANALNKVAWNIESVPYEYKADFNSLLTLVECLNNSLNSVYRLIKDEV